MCPLQETVQPSKTNNNLQQKSWFFKNKNLPEKGDGCKLKSILGSKIFLPEILRPFHPELHPPPGKVEENARLITCNQSLSAKLT